PATVLSNCLPVQLAQVDDVFCGISPIIKAGYDDDAMRIANDSRYGLGGGIFTRDADKAHRLARDQFNTGMGRIKAFGAADPNLPDHGLLFGDTVTLADIQMSYLLATLAAGRFLTEVPRVHAYWDDLEQQAATGVVGPTAPDL
ncbi:MAG: aldehyde dehydrogenase family protein, partial [Pseudomonadota bacterium]